MAEIQGAWAVNGTYVWGATLEIPKDATPEEMADLIESAMPGPSVCHQCSDQVGDVEADELVSFTVNGVTWNRDTADGEWERER